MALDLTGFKQTFNDDFNSFTSTPQGDGGWQSTIYGARTLSNNGEQQFYSDSTVGVDPFSAHDGTLTITASPGSNPDGLAYNSGVISTLGDFSQQYGYFEMTAKLPQGAGMWPGFWLLQADHSWPPELDVLEAFGATNSRGEGGADQAHINMISTVPGESHGNWVTVPGNAYDEFHSYGVDWEPDTTTYYIDGQEVGKVATPADMHKPMYMIANLAVGGGWAENPNGETSSMVIDNIRAYSKDPSAVAVAQPSTDAPDAAHSADTGSDAAIMPPAGSTQADATGGTPADSTGTVASTSTDPTPTQPSDTTAGAATTDGSAGSTTMDHAMGSPNVTTADAAAPTDTGTSGSPADLTSTDPTHTQPLDTTAGAATTDGSAGSTTMDHAMGSPNVTTADATAPSDTGTSGSPADSTSTDAAHPATTVADGSTGGTATDHATGAPDVTTLASDTPPTNVGTPAADSTTTDMTHPGTTVADGSTGGAATDHATGSPDVTTLASDTPPANVGTATPAADSTTTDMTHPGTTVADGTGSTTLDHAASSPDITGDASAGATNGAGTSAAMTPDASEASASAGAGLTLHVSADSWNGAPQFQVFVDGKQAGDVHTATADHGAGQWEDVAINGDFGPGAHVVDVKFVNDGWNGTADTDRNLYVQSIAMNDATLAGNEAANDAHHGAWATDPSAAVMQINGDVEFHVPQSTTSGDLWAA